jgi:hypothetical protein
MHSFQRDRVHTVRYACKGFQATLLRSTCLHNLNRCGVLLLLLRASMVGAHRAIVVPFHSTWFDAGVYAYGIVIHVVTHELHAAVVQAQRQHRAVGLRVASAAIIPIHANHLAGACSNAQRSITDICKVGSYAPVVLLPEQCTRDVNNDACSTCTLPSCCCC